MRSGISSFAHIRTRKTAAFCVLAIAASAGADVILIQPLAERRAFASRPFTMTIDGTGNLLLAGLGQMQYIDPLTLETVGVAPDGIVRSMDYNASRGTYAGSRHATVLTWQWGPTLDPANWYQRDTSHLIVDAVFAADDHVGIFSNNTWETGVDFRDYDGVSLGFAPLPDVRMHDAAYIGGNRFAAIMDNTDPYTNGKYLSNWTYTLADNGQATLAESLRFGFAGYHGTGAYLAMHQEGDDVWAAFASGSMYIHILHGRIPAPATTLPLVAALALAPKRRRP